MEQTKKKKEKSYTLFTLLPNLKGYRFVTVLVPLFMVLEVVLEVLIPAKMAEMVNTLQHTLESFAELTPVQLEVTRQATMQYLLQGGLIMVLMCIGSLCAGMLAAVFGAKSGVGFGKNIRKSLFYKVQTFAFSNIDGFSTAGLITRCTTDITNVQNCYTQLVRSIVRSPLTFILATIMAFRLNPNLALIFVVAIPALAVVCIITFKFAFPRFRAMLKNMDNMNATVQENLIGMRVVKAFVREEHEITKFNNRINELMNSQISAEKAMVYLMPFVQLMMYACKLAITGYGGTLVIKGELEVGDLSAMITYAVQILNSLLMLSMLAVQYVTSRASMQRIGQVLSEKVCQIDTPSDNIVENGSITFSNVNFAYNGDVANPVLQDINLSINSGEVVGIIGGTGEGKSSLIQLIPRLYEAQSGTITVGGKNIYDYSLAHLRDSVSVVLQKNVLFSGSIKENLMWGDMNSTDDEIVEACVKAQANEFIRSFPSGYDTWLGQGGVTVSGGQKQRLCIARALLKKPKILILDDSTSAVDTATDEKIRTALADTLPGTTKIIIAQRIASVMAADKIIILDEGKIDAVGTHEQLLATNKIYQEVYHSQIQEGQL